MSSPRVTVILSSLNHQRFIGDAIQSVLEQTYGNFELIIIDDCSEDESWKIIQSFHDPRITAIRNPKRMRGAYGFNEAISHRAKGEFIAIHHSDDTWLQTKLEQQVAFLDRHPKAGAVFTQVHLIDEAGASVDANHYYQNVFSTKNRNRFEWLRHFFSVGNCLCHPSVLARRQTMVEAGLYDRRLGQITDFDLWVRICLHHEIHILDEALTQFRLREGNANQSGESDETYVRLRNEWYVVLERFRAIDTEDAFFSVFPEMRSSVRPGTNNLPYLLGIRATQEEAAFRKQFGLALLYELMADYQIAAELKEKYGFGYSELIRLTGRIDPFQGTEVSRLTHLIRRQQRDIMLIKRSMAWLWRIAAPVVGAWRAVGKLGRRREGPDASD